MRITYDPGKNAINIKERDLPFDLVQDLDWDSAIYRPDLRRDYGEYRLRVFAMLHGRLHVAVITPRHDGLRVISFRKANAREEKFYEEEKA